MAPRKRWSDCRGHDGGTARKRTEEQTAFWEAGHVAGAASPSETTEEHGMWDRGGLHAVDNDKKVDEEKEENRSDRIEHEEQEEKQQMARAFASPDIPSRRVVEEHNLTHIPCRSWCNHCL